MDIGNKQRHRGSDNANPNVRARLSDKFDLAQPRALLTGAQAIVRLVLMQKARDAAAGRQTAGYVSGYRGSPLATVDAAFGSAAKQITANDIHFQPAVNEELAATAIWGTQQAELRGEGRHDGVFALWYAKGPGVDRAGDALRHANHAGTSRFGGVLALMGDDHICESSTSAHQSEFAFIDAMIPILAPSNVQEIVDFGLLGFALSRYAGVWVSMKCVKDNAEGTATVDTRLDRIEAVEPSPAQFEMPAGGLNIRLGDTPLSREARWHDFKRDAIHAFASANALDKVVFPGGDAPRIGIITSGKSYADTRQALSDLGIDHDASANLGVSLLKIGMTWPLNPASIRSFARGLDLIIVVEEKRAVVEPQIKEILFDAPDRPRVIGKTDGDGHVLFAPNGALDPLDIAIAVGERIAERNPAASRLTDRLAELHARATNRPADVEPFSRVAYFCAGCPHNTSTRVPEGTRAYAGIGCHYMAQWMDRDTEGFTQMGGEGANWVGEAPFSKRDHIFQNIGDGTFVHSGSLAIRAAAAAKTKITFKILYNDAVAMTGGQPLEGNMTVAQMAAASLAEGAARVDIVSEDPRRFRMTELPGKVRLHHRKAFDRVQRELAKIDGVTVLIYDQTCAAEKRRRRRRGALADPGRRVFINSRVCEGCGDCGLASNCVAIQPLETEFGRKRQIDQSACNMDFSCVEGFCPSFVTLHGAQVRTTGSGDENTTLPAPPDPVPEPDRPALDKPYSILAAGIGGTGVVTISAVLGQAAHLAGQGFGAIDVTGIAQKGGPVACHMRIAATPDDIHAVRVGTADADLVLGGDLVVTASNKVLETIAPGCTNVVLSNHGEMPGEFTRDPTIEIPHDALKSRIEQRVAGGPLFSFDAQDTARKLLGDTIFANMLLLGAAYQRGAIPIAAPAIEEAIALNGAAVDKNKLAFRYGRLAAFAPDRLAQRLAPENTKTDENNPRQSGKAIEPREQLDALIEARAADLIAYQDAALAERYRIRVASIRRAENECRPDTYDLSTAVARNYYKLLAVKDEWEVARLFTDGAFKQDVDKKFTGVSAYTFHMAPPLLARRDKHTGRPRKLALPGWLVWPLLEALAKRRHWRGTWADPFRLTAERRTERKLISDYEADLDEIAASLSPANYETALALTRLPEQIRGYGHVKERTIVKAGAQRALEISALRSGLPPGRKPPSAA